MKISVCIPTYNGEKYILKQIESILKQLNEDDEIIISDDGSTDNTLNILRQLDDKRIKILYHVKSKETKFKFNLVTKNIENALNHSSGDYIFLADQDDIWQDNRIRIVTELLKDADLVLNDCILINETEQIVSNSYFDIIKPSIGFFKNIAKNSYLGCCMAFNRHILNYVLPFPKGKVPHDIWIGLIAEHYGKVKITEQKLVFYRRHGNNLSFSSEKSNHSLLFKLHYRLNLIILLLKRFLYCK
ncbi:MAG: glycosyltransferase family 2 protein [Arachidicoccus sp.]|nr:glycosyltransferase family 2 protein [Arachidicoccus sp.]